MKNLLQGEWRFIRSEIFSNGCWEKFQTIENDSIHWEFAPAQEMSLGFEGTLTERDKGCKDNQTTYLFDPIENIVTIDRSTYLEDGCCDICEEEIFKVELSAHTNAEQRLYYFTILNTPDFEATYFRYLLQKS